MRNYFALQMALAVLVGAMGSEGAMGQSAASATAPAAAVSVYLFPTDKAAVTFRLGQGLYTRELVVDGTPIGCALIDTGCSTSVIDSADARRMKLPQATYPMIGSDATGFVRVDELRIGEVGLRNHLMATMDLGGLRKVTGVGVHAIVGSDLLARSPFTLDCRAGTLTIHNAAGFKPPADAKAYPMAVMLPTGSLGRQYAAANGRAGIPAIDIAIGGHAARLILDTGADEALGMSAAFTAKHPELIDYEGGQRVGNMTAVGRRTTYGLRVKDFALFGQTIALRRTPSGIVGDFTVSPADAGDGGVGLRALRDFRLTFDYAGEKVWARWDPPASIKAQLAAGLAASAEDLAGESALTRAVRDSDVEGFEALLGAGAKIDIVSKAGKNLLHMVEEPRIAARILAAGKVDVDAASGIGVRPLMYAVYARDTAVLKLLLEGGADPKRVDAVGNSALYHAIFGRNLPAVEMLLAHGAVLEDRNEEGLSPLDFATNATPQIFEALLKHGASVDHPRKDKNTLLHGAAQAGNAPMVAYLLKKYPGPVDPRTGGGFTPLMGAAANGHAAAVSVLLDAGADMAATATAANDGATALHLATYMGHPETVKLLLKRGAAANVRSAQSQTPLMVAARQGHTVIVEALLAAKADVEAVDDRGWTALFHAASFGHTDALRVLLKAKANANAANSGGLRPLHVAAANGHPNTVLLLLEAGADASAKTIEGDTVLDMAKKKGHGAVVLAMEAGR